MNTLQGWRKSFAITEVPIESVPLFERYLLVIRKLTIIPEPTPVQLSIFSQESL